MDLRDLHKMSVVIRADSSSEIGIGHIMRDIVLAKREFANERVIFAVRELEGNINNKILEEGFEIKTLQTDSIDELISLIKEVNAEILVIDHYGIDYDDEFKIKSSIGITIFVLDDTYEKHYCDILLNHNISADSDRYKKLVPKECEIRCGIRYTLIRDEFIQAKKSKTLFIAMGGSDKENISLEVLKVLESIENIYIILVTTSSNPNIKILEEYISNRDNVDFYIDSNRLARLMKCSNIAIISPSVIVHEVLYMGLPFIAIKTADNQEDIFNYLKKNNYIALDKFDRELLLSSLNSLME